MRSFFARTPVPTGRLAVLAALGSIAAGFVPANTVMALLVVNAMLLAVAAVDAFAMTPALGRIDVVRRFPAVVPLGRAAPLEWAIENGTARAVTVELADALPPSWRAGTRRVSLSVPAGGSAVAATTIRPSRRGRFAVDELTLRVAGSLGLASRQVRRPVTTVVRVYPGFASRAEAELRINRGRLLEVGLRSAQGLGGGTDFDRLREYGPDDEFRRIDWAATARMGKPIVRTYRAERNQTVLQMLDTGRTSAARVADVPRLEHAMDAVMALTTVATRLGDRAGLIAFDDDVRAVVPPSHSRGQLGRVTEAMYQLQPRLAESDYAAAFTSALARFRRRALLVVYTDLAEQAVADTLMPALPLVARDHIVVLASVRDPDVVGWARRAPEHATDAYVTAAAVAALEERRRLVFRLRGMGVTVVDEPPGRLAPALADAYLTVKATGRL